MKIFLACTVLFSMNFSFAQNNILSLKIGEYELVSNYDEENYASTLSIFRNGSKVNTVEFDERVTDIKKFDLENSGTENMLIDTYSGGAHCCFTMMIADFNEGNIIFRDSIYWGNSLYEIKDLNNDGISEIVGGNDVLAYSFAPYAWTEFPLMIYTYKNGNTEFSNKNFLQFIEDDIEVLMSRLKEMAYFKCPESGEDTFFMDAGKAKGILAAIVYDYHSIGEVEKGYDFLNKIYNCPDRESFIEILKTDFDLK